MGGSEPESEATPVPYRPVDVTGRRIRPQSVGSHKAWGHTKRGVTQSVGSAKRGVRSFFATFIGKNPRIRPFLGILQLNVAKKDLTPSLKTEAQRISKIS